MTSFTITIDAPLIVAALDRLTAAILQCGGGGMDSRPTASGGPPTPIPALIVESPSGAVSPATHVPVLLPPEPPAAPDVTNPGAAAFLANGARAYSAEQTALLKRLVAEGWTARAMANEICKLPGAQPTTASIWQKIRHMKDAGQLPPVRRVVVQPEPPPRPAPPPRAPAAQVQPPPIKPRPTPFVIGANRTIKPSIALPTQADIEAHIARHGVTRLPTAAAEVTTATIPEEDRAALAARPDPDPVYSHFPAHAHRHKGGSRPAQKG